MSSYRQRMEAGEYDAPAGGEAAEAEPESQAAPEAEVEPDENAQEQWLIDLTKNELIEKAQSLGISPANAAMTKAELIEAIQAAA